MNTESKQAIRDRIKDKVREKEIIGQQLNETKTEIAKLLEKKANQVAKIDKINAVIQSMREDIANA